MIPRPDSAQRMLAQRIMSTLIPGLDSTYARSDGGMVALLLGYLAGEIESGVARRMADVGDMSKILSAAAEKGLVSPDWSLAQPADLTMASVTACHAKLTAALIELHAALESDPCPAPEILAAIWRYLDAHSARHQLG